MKKILYIFSVTVLLALHSCTNQDPGNWFPEAADYTGRFVVAFYWDEAIEDNLLHDYDSDTPIYLYNTAENSATQIWFSDEGGFFPLRIKLDITGPATEFYTPNRSFDAGYDNYYEGGDINGSVPAPTAAGQSHSEDSDVARAAIELGKILPGAATTPGGNKADSIYLKLNLYGGTVQYESYLLDEEDWTVPNTPEYAWRFKQIVANPAYDDTYVFSGFRWTGYDEDMVY